MKRHFGALVWGSISPDLNEPAKIREQAVPTQEIIGDLWQALEAHSTSRGDCTIYLCWKRLESPQPSHLSLLLFVLKRYPIPCLNTFKAIYGR